MLCSLYVIDAPGDYLPVFVTWLVPPCDPDVLFATHLRSSRKAGTQRPGKEKARSEKFSLHLRGGLKTLFVRFFRDTLQECFLGLHCYL